MKSKSCSMIDNGKFVIMKLIGSLLNEISWAIKVLKTAQLQKS